MSTLTRHSDRISRDQLGWRWICGRRDEREMKKERRKEGKKEEKFGDRDESRVLVTSPKRESRRTRQSSRNTAGIQQESSRQRQTDRQTRSDSS